MDRQISYQITKEYENLYINDFLKRQGYTHHVLVQLKKTENGIVLNGNWAYVKDRIHEGDHLSILLKEPEYEQNIVPTAIPFGIIYEDEDILVVDKPSGMPVHPSINHYENTLSNAVIYYSAHKNESYPFRCINRLDRDTTGLTIIAKNMLSAGILSSEIRDRILHRTYLAVCQGLTPEEGTIDAPIARKEASTVERCVNFETGEHAVTHYTRLAYDSKLDLSTIKLVLETGRTHQIRVHMKHINHPLIGDFLYNPDYQYISRQALHSLCLDFIHPITKKEMHLASDLPDDLKRISSMI